MPTFSIEIIRTTDETTWIDVEAADITAAEAAAIEQAKGLDDADWDYANIDYNAVDQGLKANMFAAMEKDIEDSLAEATQSQ